MGIHWSFPNGAELSLNSANSGNLTNHRSMNWAKFLDPVSFMSLGGAMVVPCFLAQQVTGSSPFNDKYFFTEFTEKKYLGKTALVHLSH